MAFFATLAVTAAAAFSLVGESHGVKVYHRETAEAIELIADGDVHSPPAEVQAVLIDYAEARRLSHNLAETHVLFRGEGEQDVYQRLDLPVIADRDYTLRVTWTSPPKPLRVDFAIDNSLGPDPKKGRVRMSLLSGSWELEPIDGGTGTRAHYQIKLDFAGKIPRWMVKDGAARELPVLFENLRRLAIERRLGDASTP